jgi:hypothetical protein
MSTSDHFRELYAAEGRKAMILAEENSRLRAEVNRLTKEHPPVDKSSQPGSCGNFCEACASRDDEIKSLRAEVERMKWLEKTVNRAGHLSIAMQEIERLTKERDQIIEKCAEVCEKEAGEQPLYHWEWAGGVYEGCMDCAAAIRAMKG